MEIERRQRLALAKALRHAGEAGEQIPQGLVDFQNDLRAARRKKRDVSAELDGVAEPLLVVQQQRLALDRLGTEPERLIERAMLQPQRRRLPAPFGLTPADFEIALAQPIDREIPVRIAMVRLQRQRLPVTR